MKNKEPSGKGRLAERCDKRNREKISAELLTRRGADDSHLQYRWLIKKVRIAIASRRQYGLVINKKRKTSDEMEKEIAKKLAANY